MGHHESNAREDEQKDPVQPDTPGHTIVDMEIPVRSAEERLAELDSLNLTPFERLLSEGYIEQSEEALVWSEAALDVMPPIDDGGYPDEYFEQSESLGPPNDAN